MVEKFEQPQQTAYIVEGNKVVGTITMAGPILRMPCAKKIQYFEKHKYWGAIPLNKDGMQALRIASDFQEKYEKWKSGGMLVEGDLCVLG